MDCSNAPDVPVDLVYQSPAAAPVEGHPIGNGRMGTMVWTTPGTLELQINRVDVFAVNKHHRGIKEGPTDYCGACARVSLHAGGDVFHGGPDFVQRLSLHGAEDVIEGEGVRVRCFVSAVQDVLALEVDDRRTESQPLRVELSMWREPEVTTGTHTARYGFHDLPDTAAVVQTFNEGDYTCGSAVAAQFAEAGEVHVVSDRCRTITVPAAAGKRLLLVASAASWNPEGDLAAVATALLQECASQTYEALFEAHAAWWAEFWSRTFVHISTSDSRAHLAQRARELHLYLVASTSRGVLPPKWNGLLFSTEGDSRQWGSQFWVWTTEMMYWPLYAADAADLAEPFFRMYLQQLPDCEQAARQRWGAEGAFYGETTPFDGPVVLPDGIADEYQDVVLGRKPNTELSAEAREWGQFDYSLAVFSEKRDVLAGRYTWISHVCSSGAELAMHAWWRFRCTGDMQWLRACAYPLLCGAAEFYRTFARKGEDGRWHILGTNAHEDFWGVDDSIMDLAAIRGTVPLALHAAEVLNVDATLREGWRDLLENLAPYPMGSDARSQALTGGVLAPNVWAAGHLDHVDGQHNSEDVWLNPVFPFEDWTLETRDAIVDPVVHRLLDLAPRHAGVLAGAALPTAIRTPVVVARAGRGEDLPEVIASYWRAFSPLSNGLSLFEGANAQSCEHLGLLTLTVQEALLQSVSPRPGEPEVISVFPAWPRDWDAEFRLLARGGFLVSTRRVSGEVEFVEVLSRRGERCLLRNPWGGRCRVQVASGASWEVAGDLLTFETVSGETYRVSPVS